jgi:hypothetical protein
VQTILEIYSRLLRQFVKFFFKATTKQKSKIIQYFPCVAVGVPQYQVLCFGNVLIPICNFKQTSKASQYIFAERLHFISSFFLLFVFLKNQLILPCFTFFCFLNFFFFLCPFHQRFYSLFCHSTVFALLVFEES